MPKGILACIKLVHLESVGNATYCFFLPTWTIQDAVWVTLWPRERERESDGQMVTIVFPENPMQRFFIARVQLCINLGDMNLLSSALLQGFETITLQETNISPKNGILKMIFLFPRWDMLIPWRVYFAQIDAISSPWDHGQFMPPGSTWTYKYGNDTVARQ